MAFVKNIREFREFIACNEISLNAKTLLAITKAYTLNGMKSNAAVAQFLGIPERTLENWVSDGPNHREPPEYLLTLMAYALYCSDCFAMNDLLYDPMD